jgi:hypothetical protein
MANESVYHQEDSAAEEAYQETNKTSHDGTSWAILCNKDTDNNSDEQAHPDRGKLNQIVSSANIHARGNIANDVIDFSPRQDAVA